MGLCNGMMWGLLYWPGVRFSMRAFLWLQSHRVYSLQIKINATPDSHWSKYRIQKGWVRGGGECVLTSFSFLQRKIKFQNGVMSVFLVL